jgi:lysylphosphatidylglycerol synthetase-like protein (DUF2156 family)
VTNPPQTQVAPIERPRQRGVGDAGATGSLSPRDQRVIELLRSHADHTSAFLTFNDGTEHYIDPKIEGTIAYARAGRHLIQLCGPIAPAERRPELLASFKRWAEAQRLRITAVQLLRDDAELYANSGFTVNQFGSSYSIDLEQFTLRGTRFMKLRNKLKRAKRLGVTVEEILPSDRNAPAVRAELDHIDAAWLRGKGRLAKQLKFMVGVRGGRGGPLRRLFVARHKGRAVAYVTYSPVFGEHAGWLYDLTRRDPSSPPGTIELIFHTALQKLESEGCRWIHLGLTPWVGFDRKHEIDGFNAPARFFMEQVGRHGGFVYPALTQLEFKLKWAPEMTPEYIAWQGNLTLGSLWHFSRVTGNI